MGGEGSVKRIEDRAALLGAGGTHRPYALGPLPSGLTPRALRDAPVDHHKPQRVRASRTSMRASSRLQLGHPDVAASPMMRQDTQTPRADSQEIRER